MESNFLIQFMLLQDTNNIIALMQKNNQDSEQLRIP